MRNAYNAQYTAFCDFSMNVGYYYVYYSQHRWWQKMLVAYPFRHFLLLSLPCNLSIDFVYLSGIHVLIILIEKLLTKWFPSISEHSEEQVFPTCLKVGLTMWLAGANEIRAMMLVVSTNDSPDGVSPKKGQWVHKSLPECDRHVAWIKNKLFSFKPLTWLKWLRCGCHLLPLLYLAHPRWHTRAKSIKTCFTFW